MSTGNTDLGTMEAREVRRVVNIVVKVTGVSRQNDKLREGVRILRDAILVYITIMVGVRIATTLGKMIMIATPENIAVLIGSQFLLTEWMGDTTGSTMAELS